MNKFFKIILFFPFLILSSCTMVPSEDKITKNFSFDNATSLEINNFNFINETYKLTVNVSGGETCSASINSFSNYASSISIKVSDNVLKISGSKNYKYSNSDISIDIFGFTFENIKITCPTKISFETATINQRKTNINLSNNVDASFPAFGGFVCDISVSDNSSAKFDQNQVVQINANASNNSSIKFNLIQPTYLNVNLLNNSTFFGLSYVYQPIEILNLKMNNKCKFNGNGLTIQDTHINIRNLSETYLWLMDSIDGCLLNQSYLKYSGYIPNDNINIECDDSSFVERVSEE